MSITIEELKNAVRQKMRQRNAEVIESFGILLVHHKSSRQFRWFENWQELANYYNIS